MLPCFFSSVRAIFMGSFLKHTVLSAFAGLGLAAGVWLVCWLGAFALGAEIEALRPALWIALAVGVVSAVAASTIVAWLRGPESAPAVNEPRIDSGDLRTLEKRLRKAEGDARRWKRRKRRRHPLDKNPFAARITPSLRFQSMSRALAELLRGQHVGKPLFSRLHPEDVHSVDQAFTLAREKRQVQRVLCRFLTTDSSTPLPASAGPAALADTKLLPALTPGTFVHMEMMLWARLDRSGKPVHYACRFNDMTPIVRHKETESRIARKMVSRAKKKLRSMAQDLERLKLSYRELYQNAPVMYFSLDGDGKLVTFNDTLLSTLGYERAELQNENYNLLLAPASGPGMPSRAGESETKWRKKDGTQFDVWLHTVPVFDETGKFVRYRNAALDLSEKNRLANELRARGDELERTNHSLRTINSELEAFTHVVSHDLKEPLRTLQAYSHLLAEEHAAQLGPDGFQYINHLIRASRRLGTLIDELLNLSQAGRITREPKAFNLIEIVATVRQDLVDLIQRKEAIILTEGSLPDVVGDPVRITQLLTNLVATGLKYNQNPAPKVTIGVVANGNDPGSTTVFVRDNGIGIDPAFHQQIFGIFRRLHQSDEFEGTGAGLAICKKIVEGHGGRIWVESQPGEGATFYFTLPGSPLARTPSNGKSQSDAALAGAEQPSSRRRKAIAPSEGLNGKSLSIVLVEDQADVGMIIQKLGRRDGLAITWFPTAEGAWDYLQRQPADLLLFDVNLPGISGVDLCQRVRALPHLAETPVAMFTPDQDAEKLQALRDVGADFFLTKDLLCEPAAWQQKIQELIQQIRQPAPH